ncbi:MAG: molecular chaperone TorD family protein [Gordonibacter sp.]|uniref:TorD/DmsD family molecular chaperone n=1 Tax=Gordonibacter sp. TaxID=1968902 RepID=UPI002FC79833
MDTNDLTALMNDRSLAYRFLARAYRTAPDLTFIEALRQGGADERPADDPLEAFFNELAAASAEQMRIDVAADYNRLFLGMGPHPIAPYESVFSSAEGLLMQEARDEVVAVYHSEGFAVEDAFNLPEDHLSLELEFMALMAERTALSLEAESPDEAERCLSVQRAFLEDHLGCWVPAFCDAVSEQARTTFFRGLARMTNEQVEADRTLIASL